MDTRTLAGLALAVGGGLDAVGAIAFRAGAPVVGFLFTLVGLALIGLGLLWVFRRRGGLLPVSSWGRVAGLIAGVAYLVEALLALLGFAGVAVPGPVGTVVGLIATVALVVAGLGCVLGHRHPSVAGILLLVIGVVQALVFLLSFAPVDLWWAAIVTGLLFVATGVFVLRPRKA